MESLEQLNGYRDDVFERWLEQRLRDQYSGDQALRYWAFDFRDIGIPRGESHIDALVELHRKLSSDAKNDFIDAIEGLMRHAQPDTFPIDAMADLVLLIGLLRAHKGLAAFVPVLGTGPWGERHNFLIYDALGVLLMFDRTSEAYEVAKGLATSVNFPDVYVFDVCLVLVRSRPKNWLIDLAMLRERFSRARERFESSSNSAAVSKLDEREKDFVTSLSEAVPLSEIAEQLPDIRLGPSSRDPATNAADDWFLTNLIGRGGPLRLEYSDSSDALVLVDRSDRARIALLRESDEFEVACISRGLVHSSAADYPPTNDRTPSRETRQRLRDVCALT